MVDNIADERRILKQHLTRYYQIKQRQELLRNRLAELQTGNQARKHGEISSVEKRIMEQAEAAEQSALEIMDIIELLQEASTERTIMELRHIDCKPWREVHAAVHLTRSPCYEYYKRGLDTLLKAPTVREAIGLVQR